jgi:hypothetical protein
VIPPSDIIPDILVQELASQLDNWLKCLPTELQWEGDIDLEWSGQAGSPSQSKKFKSSEDSTPMEVDFVSGEILGATLQTRYKYAQYHIWRSYLYKVLHYPELTTKHDLEGCQKALKVNCLLTPCHLAFSDIALTGMHILASNPPCSSNAKTSHTTFV